MLEQVLEKDRPLSQSILWKLQETAYCQFGIRAWSHEGVPFYITSNPYTAKCYAYVVLGYLRDLFANNQIDLAHPIYMLDLGAGSGRFAFLFLKELLSLLQGARLAHLKIRYVMTDIVEDNLAFWRQHPYLKPYFESGVAESAYFHHAQQEPIQLIGSGEILDESLLVNPLIAIGNYFFDTIPQDLFRVQKGVLEEGRVTLFVEGETAPVVSDPEIINHLHARYNYAPVSMGAPYYQDPDVHAVLETYHAQFDGCTFLFPIGAFQTIQRLKRLSKQRLLFIAGDQGVCTAAQIRAWGEPKLSLHGSFSIAVSYHAIAALVQRCGGQALMTSQPNPSFVVMAGIFAKEAAKRDYFCETRQAFVDQLDDFEPADYWRLVSLAEKKWVQPPLEYVLLLIKLGNWDPMSFHAFFSVLREGIVGASEEQKQQLVGTIERVWENFYPITPGEGDFVLNMGVLLFDMQRYAAALDYFERSISISGPTLQATQNIVACRAKI